MGVNFYLPKRPRNLLLLPLLNNCSVCLSFSLCYTLLCVCVYRVCVCYRVPFSIGKRPRWMIVWFRFSFFLGLLCNTKNNPRTLSTTYIHAITNHCSWLLSHLAPSDKPTGWCVTIFFTRSEYFPNSHFCGNKEKTNPRNGLEMGWLRQ